MASYHIETSVDGGLTWRGHGELAPATKREAVKMAQQMLSLLPTQQARILAVYKAKYRGVAIVWTGEPKKPTVAAVKAHCKALGLSCRRVDGEYRIAWAGDEASAHYTNDGLDAMGTATAMAKAAQLKAALATQIETERQPADFLVNGYPVVLYRAVKGGAVVAVDRGNHLVYRYAVWTMGEGGDCLWGDYVSNLAAAECAFNAKVRRATIGS